MVYQGSKRRLAKDFKPIFEKLRDDLHLLIYREPFVGGANMIVEVDFPVRLGSDSNEDLIFLLKKVRDEQKLDYFLFSKSQYDKIKRRELLVEPWQRGYAMFLMSYNSKYEGSYIPHLDNGGPKYINHVNNLNRQAPKLKGIQLTNNDFTQIKVMRDTLLYLDPPYINTEGYKQEFDHDKLGEKCQEGHDDGATILLSESTIPNNKNGNIIYEREIVNNLRSRFNGSHGVKKMKEYLLLYTCDELCGRCIKALKSVQEICKKSMKVIVCEICNEAEFVENILSLDNHPYCIECAEMKDISNE